MNGKTKSILLQVAFKEATSADSDPAAVKLLTSQYYTLLQELHTELSINADEGAPRGGGGGGRGFGGGGGAPKPKPEGAFEFTAADGTQWYDYRAPKATNGVNAKHPDFKTSDNQQSVWIFAQDGSTNDEATALITAADARAGLTAPM